MPNRDPEIITSPLSRIVSQNGMAVDVQIERCESDPGWAFKIVNENGTTFHWPDACETDEEALTSAMDSIAAHGIESFRDDAPCPLCGG